MKKITSILLSLCMMLSVLTVSASEWEHIYVDINDVNITVDGEYVYARNFVHEGTTYLSLRDMGTVLGYEVGWDGETSTASLTSGAINEYNFTQGAKSSETIAVLVNDVNVVVDGVKVDARNFLYNDTTYLALRDIGNATGFDVYWDEPSYTAVLTSPGKDRVIPSQNKEIPEDGLYATVNSVEVPRIFVKAAYDQAVQNYSGEEVYDFLEYNIMSYAYYVEQAEKFGLTVTEEEEKLFDEQFEQYVNAYGGQEEFNKLVAAAGYTLADYEKQMKDYTITTQLIVPMVENYLYENEDAFKELKEKAKPEYEKEADQLKRPTVVVKHILIPFENNSNKHAEKAKAEAILSLLEKGEDFETVLSQNNNDPGQPSSGYEVYTGSGFVEEFEKAALELKKGEISKIVETSYGYHIIKAIDDYVYQASFDEFLQSAYREEVNKIFEQLYSTWLESAVLNAGWNK